MAGKFDLLKDSKPIDIVFKIEENEWNGAKSLQMKVIDIRASSE
jgi:single-stranded-DNA-specific exonuclease